MKEKELINGKPIKIISIVAILIMLYGGLGTFTLFALIIDGQECSDMLPVIFILVFGIFLYFYFAKCKITVTNKKVYGTATFGQRIDLPFDSISAVSTMYMKGISVGTSSGRIKFFGISNNQAIFNEINKLLNARQDKNFHSSSQNNINVADELKKYKDLLDSGAITQGEFDKKKKELLK